MSNKTFKIPEKMHAIEIKEFGAPENLNPCFRPIPKLSNNQVLIKVTFAGVNRQIYCKDRVIIKSQTVRQIYLV